MSDSSARAWIPWVGVFALALWAAAPGPLPLLIAAGAFLASWRAVPATGSAARWAVVVGVAGALAGAAVELRVATLRSGDPGTDAAAEARTMNRLAGELDRVVDRSLDAVRTLASEIEEGNAPGHDRVRTLRMRGGFDGVAVFDADGGLRVWDGDHRGRVPDRVRRGEARYLFGDLPLARHFYVTERLPDGGTVMVSTLLQSDLPPAIRAREGDVVQRWTDRTGERIEVLRPGRLGARESTFAYRWQDETLFSVVLERRTVDERVADVRRTGRRAVSALVLLLWGLLLAASRGSGRQRRIAVLALPALAVLLPPAAVPGLAAAAGADGTGAGMATLPFDLGLGRLVLLLASLAVVSGLVVPPRSWRTSRVVAGVAVAGLSLAIVAGFRSLAGPAVLVGPETGWIVWASALGVALGIGVWGVFVSAPGAELRRGPVLAGLAALALLSVGGALAALELPGFPTWAAALWAIPVLLLRDATSGVSRRAGGPLWVAVAATGIGMSLALPVAWGDRLDARMAAAEADLGRLGTGPNPELETLLRRMATGVERLDAVGARPVELLYEGWRNSGLAEAGYPVWMTLWSPGGLPEEDLPVGTEIRARPAVADAWLDQAIEGDTITVRRVQNADAHYVVEVPLRGGWVVTGVVPPLRSFGGNSLLGPLLGATGESATDPLTLVPLLASESAATGGDIRWIRTGDGWRAELDIDYPGARYTAQYEVPVAGWLVIVARAGILVLLALAGVAALHGGGRLLQGVFGRGPRIPWSALRTFRARITLALFAFFAVSNLGFGTLAYRTIAGASERASEVLAERVVQEAESAYFDVQGQIDFLAQQVGSELLAFEDAALREGSLDPLVELGLYQGWVPWEVNRQLTRREVVQATRRTSVGGGAYVTSYRRLPDGDVIAAPVPLQAGAAAVRAREVVHLLVFAMLGGALLSLVLALLTGRALSQPIQTLRIASERVGSGNLKLRLPEERDDEFGRVFEAFNRMVRRLQRARRTLLRTTQRTRAIVEDSATGVVALDAQGRVTLVNPRARELLGEGLVEDEPIGAAIEGAPDDATRAILEWIRRWQEQGPRETSADLQAGGRRLRVRGRRITREGPAEGVVVNLEDVTDELRAERVIAWGEMARQVAHEVKNPLTPIKLSIQHIRRAWTDGRPDFDDILSRNADAMLAEIDRLAEIASGFSRFGAPGESESPLEGVDLSRVVADVLALYAGPGGPVRFESRIDGPLPPVRARGTEVKEVLVNLLENAREAVGGKGLVTVHVFLVEGAVRMQVVDDGIGIPEEILGRIFEPQFSTRSTGTGLGLAIVRRLVERWGAAVSVRSRPGEGTTFLIDLKVWDGG